MNINIRNDSVEIEGYVNAIERNSKPLASRMGRFIERICKGAFKRALERNKDVRLLLNHDWDRELGSTKDGVLQLEEDNIGLKARAVITDKEVIDKARRGDLVGWSFGFEDMDVEQNEEDGLPLRKVRDLNLMEVSLLDRSKVPAYEGTLVSVRAENEVQYFGEAMIGEVNTREVEVVPEEVPKQKKEVKNEIDYSKYEKILDEIKSTKYVPKQQ